MGKLGYSTLTLTDLTETLPVSLVLESNLSRNIQTKIGNLYTPNFNEEGKELIITPSLFIGTEEISIPIKNSEEQDSNYIYYQTGELDENNLEINYVDSSTKDTGIWVDELGRLHYKKNLTSNITIEAYIAGFKNENHGYTVDLVKTNNPINILFLEEGNNNYNVVITSSGGREHFEEENASPIELTAELYYGINKITNVEYLWDVVTDNDELKDWSANTETITIERSFVKSVEVFSCTITDVSTGLSYAATKILRDFTDAYTNQLIADNTLILTPNNTSVKITNQVWHKTSIINNEDDQSRFEYKWSVLKINGEQIILEEEKEKILEIKIDDNIFPKENFSILGEVTIDNKVVTLNYADIKYQPVTYTVEISPKTLFVPATNEGTYRDDKSFIKNIKFQLLDDNKTPLKYDLNDSGPTALSNNNDNSSITVTRTDPNIWDFDIEFNLDVNSSNDLWDNKNSKIYEFTYEYLGQSFTEEFEVIKNYAGVNGNPGYTIDLSNSFHAFSGGEGRADLNQEVELKFSAYFGDKGLKIVKISLEDNGEEISDETEIVKGLFIKRKTTTDKVGERTYILYTSASGDNFLTENGNISFYITVEEENSIQKTFYKPFQYIINFNGKSYYLQFSENSIIYGANTNYSPSQIIATAYYRETNGTVQKYEQGRIRYSFDNINWKDNIGSIVIQMPEISLINNINIELYSAQDISWNENFLLDKETIPILVSLEGTQIGAENLLPRTKDFPIQEGLWSKSEGSNFIIDQEDDFSIINYNILEGSAENIYNKYSFFSPKIILNKEYLNKIFCLSFFIYCEDWDKIDNFSIFSEGFFTNVILEDSDVRDCYTLIGNISKNSSSMIFETEKISQKWIKVYQNFKLSSDFFITEEKAIEECNYLRISFILENFGQIKIKKPKLEIGNTPTDWSPAVNDFFFSAIEGLEGENLSEVLKDYLNKINDSNERLTLTIGNTTITSLEQLEQYLSNEIGIVKQNFDNNLSLTNGELKTLKENIDEVSGKISEVKSYINLGFEDDGTPHLLLGAKEEKLQTSMKVTDKKMIFQIDGNSEAETTLSNEYLDTNRIRAREGVYIGKTDYINNSGTGYLVISTTEQGVGFKWMNNFTGG